MGRAPGLRFGAACVAVAALAVVVPAAGAPEDRPPPPKGPPLLEDESSSRHEGRQPPAPPVTPPKPEPSPLFAAGPLDDTIDHSAPPRGTPSAGPARAPAPASTAAPRKGTTGPLARISPDFVPGQVLVRFRSGVGADARAAVLSRHGATLARELRIPGLVLARLPSGRSVRAAAAALAGERDVLYAEPNFIRRADVLPSDTEFSNLWGMHNTGQTVNGVTGSPDADIDAPEAWDLLTNSPNVVVAILDSGVEYRHPELDGNLWTNPGENCGSPDPAIVCAQRTDGVDNDGNTRIDDVHGWDFVGLDNTPLDLAGHGTHVAGTIGGEGNNASGVAGVNWQVKIMPLRFLDAGGGGSVADEIDGINYAAAKGAKVLNASFGSTSSSQAEIDAINAASGLVFVAAAGNSVANNDTSPHYPCAYTNAQNTAGNIVCVAATTPSDGLAGFSNFGATSVDLGAPGTDILSAQPAFTTIWSDNLETAGTWTTDGTNNTWARTTEVAAPSPTNSLTDSPAANYANNTNSFARRASSFSLSGQADCKLSYAMRLATQVPTGPSPSTGDVIWIESSIDGGTTWDTQAGYAGSTEGFFFEFDDELFGVAGQSSVLVRYRLETNPSMTNDGAYIDNPGVVCLSTSFGPTNFAYFDGTSMATPHVAGVAALLFARGASLTPSVTLTVAQVKSLLLESVDSKPALASTTVSGGRLNAFKALSGFCQDGAGNWQVATLIGTDGNNSITGTAGNDVIVTFSGNDQITGGGGDDRICAGGGHDLVQGNAGVDVLHGGTGNDALNGGTENDTLNGGSDHDTLRGGPDNDVLTGGPGPDWATFSEVSGPAGVSASLVTGSATGQGTDTLSEIELLEGSPFNDTLVGDGGNNILSGGGGTDTLTGNAGDDVLDGGPGDDNATLDGGPGNDALLGGDGVDKLLGGPGNDQLYGEAGDDGGPTGLLDGGDGNDYVFGGPGADKLAGGADYDVLSGGTENDQIDGGSGHDILIGDAGNDDLIGGLGADWANYEAATGPVTVDLSAIAPTGSGAGVGTDTLSGIDMVYGSPHNDTLIGDGGPNILRGEAGSDTLTGNGGDDLLIGGAGDDTTLDGGPGDDVLFGEGGIDKLLGGLGNDQLFGGLGDDGGTTGLLDGGDGNDHLFGGPGADKLLGGAGDDALNGGTENDEIDGGDGHDTLRGAAGDDGLTGGLGIDWATFSEATAGVTASLVTGSATGEGTDTLSGIDALSGSPFGDTLTGNDAPNPLRGEGGPDSLIGNGGPDQLDGGLGDDPLLDGGAGADALFGGPGTDKLVGGTEDDQLFGGPGDDKPVPAGPTGGLEGGPGDDRLRGGPGHDKLDGGDGNDGLAGGDGDDELIGGLGTDIAGFFDAVAGVIASLANGTATGQGSDTLTGIENLSGSPHNDNLTGDDAANALFGDAGNDDLFGLGGPDFLDGGIGTDTLDGGADADTCVNGETLTNCP